MVQQHIALVEHGEEIALLVVIEDGCRLELRVAQGIESRHVRQTQQHTEIERPLDAVDLVHRDGQLLAQECDEFLGSRRFGFHADDVAPPAPS